MSILDVKNLKKSYDEVDGKLEILKGVNLTINSGETIAITGQSGSGKSTLMHILGMLDNYDSGTISFNGKQIASSAKDINKFRNEKIGFVFQFHYLLEDFTAEENVAMPAFIRTGNQKQAINESRKLLEILDILPRKDHYPNKLSGGEQQRVAFARALINKPEIVFADEPTGNLDSTHSTELINLLLELNQEYNQTFVIVTHNNEIAKNMQKHYHLENGILSLVTD